MPEAGASLGSFDVDGDDLAMVQALSRELNLEARLLANNLLLICPRRRLYSIIISLPYHHLFITTSHFPKTRASLGNIEARRRPTV